MPEVVSFFAFEYQHLIFLSPAVTICTASARRFVYSLSEFSRKLGCRMLRSKETSPKLFSVLEVAGLLLWLWIQLKTSVLSFFHGVGIAGDGLWSGTVLAAGMYAALSWQLYASKQAWHASDRLQDTASASGSPKSD